MNNILIKYTNSVSSIHDHAEVVELKEWQFPGGEVGVKLELTPKVKSAKRFKIVARINSNDDLMSLLHIVDALRRGVGPHINLELVLPYVPYARQDRVCNEGESLGISVFTSIINSLNFDRVTIVDPHSDVTPVLIKNVNVVTQLDLFNSNNALRQRVLASPQALFVAPDAGSKKKTEALSKYFMKSEYIRADKVRELSTGQIKETVVYADDLTDKELFIVDDICDGGKTFTELAKVLKDKGAKKVVLFVTHGIFSKGTVPLLQGGIDEIWTTDSYHSFKELDEMKNVEHKGYKTMFTEFNIAFLNL